MHGMKPGQRRVLKIKIAHEQLAELLAQCHFVDTNKATKGEAEAAQDGERLVDDVHLAISEVHPEAGTALIHFVLERSV